MCVIVYKPVGQNEPTISILEKCFKINPDGAGYMLPLNNKVVIRKGFMTFEEFKKDYYDFIYKNEIDVVKTPIVYHFRITTQGGVKRELTHPYPICDTYEEMRKCVNTCDIALAHNGVISLTSQNWYYRKEQPTYNDTMTFIKDYASLLIANNLYFASHKNTCILLERLIGASRLAIMNKLGYVKLIGEFVKRDGIFYSNNHVFETPRTYVSTYTPRYTSKDTYMDTNVHKSSDQIVDNDNDYSDYYDEEFLKKYGLI